MLLVPSLINRWYVLDLGPGKIFDRVARRAGPRGLLHRLGHARRRGSLPDVGRHRRSLPRARGPHRRAASPTRRRRTSSATASAARSPPPTPRRFPSASRRSLALAAPIDFAQAGIMSTWTRTPTFDVARDRRGVRQRAVAADAGVVSACCARRCSAREGWSRSSTARGTTSSSTASSPSRRWGNDNVSFPGACYARYIEELYRENRLVAGTFSVLGRPARLARSVPGARGRVRRRSHRAGRRARSR